MSDSPLRGRTVAVPEMRLLDVLASMLEKRGATVLRCPLVAIRDADDQASVEAWIDRLIARPPDLLVLYTGEGLYRLVACARRTGREPEFVAALGNLRTLTRGPKPQRALRSLGLSATYEAPEPTTAGLITALQQLDLDGARVGVQMYGAEPNVELLEYLASRHAEVDPVAPYAYASAADDEQVVALIGRLQRGEIDAIAFTSKAQFERLRKLADRRALTRDLERGLDATRVAAVGPVVAAELTAAGIRVDAMPPESFHLKPLLAELETLFAKP